MTVTRQPNYHVRHAKENDCEQLLGLMKQLAIFEDYIDQFRVTVNDLKQHGFPKDDKSKPTYTAIVAEQGEHLVAYLVYYLIPFTFDLRPTLFIKELYVAKTSRGNGIGEALMKQAVKDAKNKRCGRLKWDVLSDNIKAQSFYQRLGASHDARWQGFILHVDY